MVWLFLKAHITLLIATCCVLPISKEGELWNNPDVVAPDRAVWTKQHQNIPTNLWYSSFPVISLLRPLASLAALPHPDQPSDFTRLFFRLGPNFAPCVFHFPSSHLCTQAILHIIHFWPTDNVKSLTIYIVAHFRCDPGYFGVYCVAYIPLPMVLKETFETRPSHDKWPEVYGGEISNVCGILVSGTALTFFKVTWRYDANANCKITGNWRLR